jgi:hypothetical protein
MSILKDKQFVNAILNAIKVLKEREQEVLILRYGLKNEPFWTLEKIGKKYGITRERSRQIINQSKKRLIKLKNSDLEKLFNEITSIIDKNGKIISEKRLVSEIGKESEPMILGAATLIVEANPQIDKTKVDHLDVFWSTKKVDGKQIVQIAKYAVSILEKNKKIIKFNSLLSHLTKKFSHLNSDFIKSIIYGTYNWIIIRGSRVGLVSWPEINPKNTRNKIYYVLDHANKPLHFKKIHERIENYDFAGRIPSVATVHNELIADERFVLIGKGIYALKKWGYNKGTVADIIKHLLKKNPSMTQEKIVEEVLKQRRVAKNTIVMNLISKPIFSRKKSQEWELKK